LPAEQRYGSLITRTNPTRRLAASCPASSAQRTFFPKNVRDDIAAVPTWKMHGLPIAGKSPAFIKAI
jgi:hypothetical protein